MLPLLLSGPETSWRQASLCLLSFGFSPFLSYFPGSSPGLPQAGPPGHLQVWQTASTPRCLNQTPHPRSYLLLPWGFPVLSSSSLHPPEANPFFQHPWSRAFHVEQSTNILFGRIMSYKYDSFGRISPFSDPDTSPICLLLI